MSKSNFLEDGVLNHVLRGTAFPTLVHCHVGLLTAAPSDAGGGTEVSGGSYARVQVNRAGGSWDAPSDNAGAQRTANAGAITFPTPSANWGVVTHFGIYDAATVGNLLYWAALTVSKTVNNGDPAPSFPIGALTVSERGVLADRPLRHLLMM